MLAPMLIPTATTLRADSLNMVIDHSRIGEKGGNAWARIRDSEGNHLGIGKQLVKIHARLPAFKRCRRSQQTLPRSLTGGGR